MPEWLYGALAALGAALGAYGAIRVELRFVWRDLLKLEGRVETLETSRFGHPRRRASDFPRVRSD